MSAYAEALGPERIAALPAALATLHTGYGRFTGEITVERPGSRLLGLIAALAGFPGPVERAPFTFTTSPTPRGDLWLREAGRWRMRTHQRGAGPERIAETLGAVTAVSRLVVADGTIALEIERMRVLGIALPRALHPRVRTRESGEGPFYRFDIEVGLPITGTVLIRYHGWLDTAQQAPCHATVIEAR